LKLETGNWGLGVIACSVVIGMLLSADAADGAAREWTVRAGGTTIELTFPGKVVAGKEGVISYKPPAHHLVVDRAEPKGKSLDLGEPLYVYGSAGIRQEIPKQRLASTEAARTYSLRARELDRDLYDLSAELRDAEAELRVAETELKALKTADPELDELLDRQLAYARHQAAVLEKRYRSREHLHRLGHVSREILDRARLEHVQAVLAVHTAEAERRAASRGAAPANVRLKELKVEDLEARLGGKDGDAQHGVLAKIEAVKGNLEGRRKAFLEESRRAEDGLHYLVKSSWDHVPIGWIELHGEDEPPLRVSFQPADSAVPPGWLADSGAAYDEERGFGWNKDRTEIMFQREGTGTNTSLAVVRGQAAWRCRSGKGRLRIVLGIGDDREWQGALVRVNRKPIYVANRVNRGEYPRVTHELDSKDDHVLIQFGGPHEKTLLSEVKGVVLTEEESARTGDKIRDTAEPSAFVAQPAQYRADIRVPREYAELFRAVGEDQSPANSDELHRLRDRLALTEARVVTADGLRLAGRVAQVGRTPVSLSFVPEMTVGFLYGTRPKERGRRITLTFSPDSATKLNLDSTLTAIATFRVPDNVTWAPSHFVGREGNRPFVVPAGTGRKQWVSGMRLGHVFLAVSGLEPGARLRRPVPEDVERPQDILAFDGEVVPGARTIVAVPRRIEGRVEDLLPDGSDVKAGEWILTVYDPWSEEKRERMDLARSRARNKYLQAARDRRVKTVEANIEHGNRILAEKVARTQLRALDHIEPLVRVAAENAHRAARFDYEHASSVVRRLEADSATSEAVLADYRLDGELARIFADSRYINLVTTARSNSWLDRAYAELEWRSARNDLDARDKVLAMNRKEEEIARIEAKREMEAALDADRDVNREHMRHFEMHSRFRAPATGRLFYWKAFNELTERFEKVDKEFQVRPTQVLGEVLDLGALAFAAELPDIYYTRIVPGTEAMLLFEHLEGLQLPARVEDVGLEFYPDWEKGGVKSDMVSNQKVFKVVFAFEPPDEFKEQLLPGVKGRVIVEE